MSGRGGKIVGRDLLCVCLCVLCRIENVRIWRLKNLVRLIERGRGTRLAANFLEVYGANRRIKLQDFAKTLKTANEERATARSGLRHAPLTIKRTNGE